MIGGKDTYLIGSYNAPVINLTENADGAIISNLNIITNNSTGIFIYSSNDVKITSNTIKNSLNDSLKDNYSRGDIKMPGIGVNIVNSNNVQFDDNNITNFEYGIYIENSECTSIIGNTSVFNVTSCLEIYALSRLSRNRLRIRSFDTASKCSYNASSEPN